MDADVCIANICNKFIGECDFFNACDDGDVCFVDSCVVGTGDCTYSFECKDGDFCMVDDCDAQSGECNFINICDDKQPCMVDICIVGLGCKNVWDSNFIHFDPEQDCGVSICSQDGDCVDFTKILDFNDLSK